MSRVKFLILLGVIILGVGMVGQANASIFSETFQPVNDTNGVPTIANGADNNWWGARFQGGGTDTDIHLWYERSTTYPGAASFEDNAGILYKLNLANYTDVTMTFNWTNFMTESNDRLRVGYLIGGLSESNFNSSTRMANLSTGNYSWSHWTELFNSTNNATSYRNTTVSLPSSDNVWIAFWMDDGEGDSGYINWVDVTGGVVPEPATLSLLGFGLLGLLGFRKRK